MDRRRGIGAVIWSLITDVARKRSKNIRFCRLGIASVLGGRRVFNCLALSRACSKLPCSRCYLVYVPQRWRIGIIRPTCAWSPVIVMRNIIILLLVYQNYSVNKKNYFDNYWKQFALCLFKFQIYYAHDVFRENYRLPRKRFPVYPHY